MVSELKEQQGSIRVWPPFNDPLSGLLSGATEKPRYKTGHAVCVGEMAYSQSPVSHSNISQSWESVSSCMQYVRE